MNDHKTAFVPLLTRTPAEWDQQDAIWLALPHDRSEWGAFFNDARASVVRLANTLAQSQRVNLLVPSDATPEHSYEIENNSDSKARGTLSCHAIPYGDIWLRDTGPIFVERNGTLEAVSFAFNGWGGKYLFRHDSDLARRICDAIGVSCRDSPLVAEGGALDSNGAGTFLSTRQCLLNENRNPDMGASRAERELASALGCRKIIWLERGLAGDHTDGHVDNLARFVGKRKVVCMAPSGPSDPNRDVLLSVRETLESACTADGEALDVVAIPSPGRIEGASGPLPASYCNFLIANSVVIVPTFECDSDAVALEALADVFPGRDIIPHAAYALLTGGGTVHCISLQEPLLSASKSQ